MTKIVSDKSLRRGLTHLGPKLKRCPEERRAIREAQLAKSTDGMSSALSDSTREALATG